MLKLLIISANIRFVQPMSARGNWFLWISLLRPTSGRQRGNIKGSKASAGLHHHVSVFLEDHVVVVVIEEDRNGAELGGSTACLGNLIWLQEMDLPHRHNIMLIIQN